MIRIIASFHAAHKGDVFNIVKYAKVSRLWEIIATWMKSVNQIIAFKKNVSYIRKLLKLLK